MAPPGITRFGQAGLEMKARMIAAAMVLQADIQAEYQRLGIGDPR